MKRKGEKGELEGKQNMIRVRCRTEIIRAVIGKLVGGGEKIRTLEHEHSGPGGGKGGP